jgi:putative ABC transport system substrate-binding protein
MNRRDTVRALLALGAASGPLRSFSQQPGKVWRIGMLETTSMAQNAANLNAFLKGMQDLGYVEGKTFVIEYRSAEGRAERFPDLAAEMVRGKIDLIVTRGTPATLAAQKASTAIPVVTTTTAVPLLFAASLARPGGNVTGLTAFDTELQGKRVELLREIVPGLARLAVLLDMGNPASAAMWKEMEKAVRSVAIPSLLLDVRKREDIGPAFDHAVRQRVGGLISDANIIVRANSKLIYELAAKHRLPVIYQSREYVIDGGLISYGVNYPDLYRRAAAYVDKILKGAKPGNLPIEQPTKFDLAINLKTAKALGITIPQSVLVRATELIQ